jgi:hypothetical protein
VRGLNEGKKCLRVRNLLKEWKVDVICFQETKLEVMSHIVVHSLWGCDHVDWCCLDFKWASSGILIMQDKRVVERIDDCVGEFTLAVTFKNIEDHFTWAFACVYGSDSEKDKRLLWDELVGLLNWWNLPWCIRSDFNVTRFPSEKSRVARLYPTMMEFSSFFIKA